MLPRYWTISAVYCYKIGGCCENCKIAKELETLPDRCRMKGTIIELVRKYGRPDLYIDKMLS